MYLPLHLTSKFGIYSLPYQLTSLRRVRLEAYPIIPRGMARGIDTVAYRVALEVSSRTPGGARFRPGRNLSGSLGVD